VNIQETLLHVLPLCFVQSARMYPIVALCVGFQAGVNTLMYRRFVHIHICSIYRLFSRVVYVNTLIAILYYIHVYLVPSVFQGELSCEYM
jgi:hypothetical protein